MRRSGRRPPQQSESGEDSCVREAGCELSSSRERVAADQAASNPLAVAYAVLIKLMEATNAPTMAGQQIATYLHVALNGEVPQADLEAATGVAQSSVSRNVALLGNGLSPKEPGYRLLRSYEDPHYRRRKLVNLTEKGEALAWILAATLAGERMKSREPPAKRAGADSSGM